MKKIYTTLMAVIIASGVTLAQKQVGSVDRVDFDAYELGSRTPTDTLWPGDFANGSAVLYSSTNGGYVIGNNGYGDIGKGQMFISGGTMVEGALFFFGGKTDGGNNSDVTIELRDMDGTGTTTAGSSEPAPGTVLSTMNIPLSGVDTSGAFTAANFSSPAYVGGDFYLGFNVSGFGAGDTLGLVSSTDGDGGTGELSWEQWSDNAWHSILEAWDLDIDLAIWAVVDNSSSGIEDESYFNGIKADIFPNPAVDVAKLVFELETASDVELTVLDLSGKTVFSADKGSMTQGQHTVNIPVSELSAGTYYYSISANGKRLTKKLIVRK